MTPVSNNRVWVQLPSPLDKPNTSPIAAKAPANAAPSRPRLAPTPSNMAASAPTAAPPEMPRT